MGLTLKYEVAEEQTKWQISAERTAAANLFSMGYGTR
jgi:hypothetical protein